MGEKAYIALGSNMGDAAVNLNGAIAALGLVPGVTVTKVSDYYITKPYQCHFIYGLIITILVCRFWDTS